MRCPVLGRGPHAFRPRGTGGDRPEDSPFSFLGAGRLAVPDLKGMKTLLLVLLTAVVAACSTASPRVTPATTSADLSGMNLSGRWTGEWRGFGLLMAPREDAVTLDLLQVGDVARGRFVLDGAAAAESVPVDVRYAGLRGIPVQAKISGDKVTLRHEAGGDLFTADLKLAGDGAHLYGLVRGSHPSVALVLTREPERRPAPPQAAMAPAAPPVRQAEALGQVEPA